GRQKVEAGAPLEVLAASGAHLAVLLAGGQMVWVRPQDLPGLHPNLDQPSPPETFPVTVTDSLSTWTIHGARLATLSREAKGEPDARLLLLDLTLHNGQERKANLRRSDLELHLASHVSRQPADAPADVL